MQIINGFNELDDFIINNTNKVLVLYFGAEWCGPCKQLKERLHDVDSINSMPKLLVGYLDADSDDNDKIYKKYKVSSLPTQLFVKLNGNDVIIVSTIVGYDFTKFRLEYDNYNVVRPN